MQPAPINSRSCLPRSWRAKRRFLAAALLLGTLAEFGCAGPEGTLSKEEVLDLFAPTRVPAVAKPEVKTSAALPAEEIAPLFAPTLSEPVADAPAPTNQSNAQSLDPSVRFAPAAIEPQEEVPSPALPPALPIVASQPEVVLPEAQQPEVVQPDVTQSVISSRKRELPPSLWEPTPPALLPSRIAPAPEALAQVQPLPQPIPRPDAQPLPVPAPLQRAAPPLLPVIQRPVPQPESLPSIARNAQPSGDLNQDIRPIGDLGINIDAPAAFDQAGAPVAMPVNYAAVALAQQPAFTRGTNVDYSRVALAGGPGLDFCYQPLFFEEVNVERYGRSLGPLQPVLSMAEFYGRMPALPYMMFAQRARTCSYHAHWNLPGYPAPFEYRAPLIRADAAFAETAFIFGLILLIP